MARESSVDIVLDKYDFRSHSGPIPSRELVFIIIPIAREDSIKMHATNCKINRSEQTEVNTENGVWLNIVRPVKQR